MSLTNLENDKSVHEMLEYFYGADELLNKVSCDNVNYMTQAAYYDAIGGYVLNFNLDIFKLLYVHSLKLK